MHIQQLHVNPVIVQDIQEHQQIVMLVIGRIMNQLLIQITLLLNFLQIALYVIQRQGGKVQHLITAKASRKMATVGQKHLMRVIRTIIKKKGTRLVTTVRAIRRITMLILVFGITLETTQLIIIRILKTTSHHPGRLLTDRPEAKASFKASAAKPSKTDIMMEET